MRGAWALTKKHRKRGAAENWKINIMLEPPAMFQVMRLSPRQVIQTPVS